MLFSSPKGIVVLAVDRVALSHANSLYTILNDYVNIDDVAMMLVMICVSRERIFIEHRAAKVIV